MSASSWTTARHIKAPLAVSAFLTTTALIFVPAQLYYGNILEFPMLFVEVLPSMAAAALIVTAALTALLLTLPAGAPRRIAIAAIFAAGVLAWVQANVLIWQYGVLNGQPIDWTPHKTHGLIDATVWCAGIAAAIVGARFVNRIVVAGSLALVLAQLAGVSFQAARSVDRWVNHYSFDDSARFAFSPTRNVVILVLDTFQTDLFQELLDDDAGLAAKFEGFTYFRNAVGGFPSTAASVPLILTGQYYENAMPFQDFVKSAYRRSSLMRALKAANYHVYYNNAYYWPSLYADETIASHTRRREWHWWGEWSRRKAAALVALGIFRCAPQAGKRLLERRVATAAPAFEEEFPTPKSSHPAMPGPHGAAPANGMNAPGDVPFFDEMASAATATMTTPTFKYYHLWGLHPALSHDEGLRPRTFPFTRANAKRQAAGIMRLLDQFFAVLRNRGVYDRSMVFIVGDHGTSFDPRIVEVDDRARATPDVLPIGTQNSAALPLVLMKPFDARGPLVMSDAPVSLADVPRTIAAAVGLREAFSGISMLDRHIPANRPRRFLKYNPDLLRMTNDYFPQLTEYTVSGFSWLEESWKRTGREFLEGNSVVRSAEMSRPEPQVYRFGQKLSFGRDGSAEPYLTEGWSAPERHITWTEGKRARLVFATEVPDGDLVFHASVVPALVGPVKRQRAELFVNGREIARWTITAAGSYSAVIPKRYVQGGAMDLLIALPDAVAPHSLNPQLADRRMLALALRSAVVEEAKP